MRHEKHHISTYSCTTYFCTLRGIIGEILGHLIGDIPTLRACSLVSKSWVPWCHERLFFDVYFNAVLFSRRPKGFPVPERGPAHYSPALRLRLLRDPQYPIALDGTSHGPIRDRKLSLEPVRSANLPWIPPTVVPPADEGHGSLTLPNSRDNGTPPQFK